MEAGYPSSGVLFHKRMHKAFQRHLRRRNQHHLLSKLAGTLSRKQSSNFWSVVHSLSKSKHNNNRIPIVDGISGEINITDLLASK